MRNSVGIVLLVAFMVIGFSAGTGSITFDIPSAYAKDDKSNDNKPKEDRSEDKTSKDGKSSDAKKVTVCHTPPGNPLAKQTLSVAESAVPAHLDHGDTLGECSFSCDCPPGVSACTCPDGTSGSVGPASSLPSASQREISGQ